MLGLRFLSTTKVGLGLDLALGQGQLAGGLTVDAGGCLTTTTGMVGNLLLLGQVKLIGQTLGL